MKLVLRHGDGAAAVLAKHSGGIAEPVVEQFGAGAVRALEATAPQGGRRLAMMMADGDLAKIGRTEELLAVVAKYGDPAMDFIWRNKGSLAVGHYTRGFSCQSGDIPERGARYYQDRRRGALNRGQGRHQGGRHAHQLDAGVPGGDCRPPGTALVLAEERRAVAPSQTIGDSILNTYSYYRKELTVDPITLIVCMVIALCSFRPAAMARVS